MVRYQLSFISLVLVMSGGCDKETPSPWQAKRLEFKVPADALLPDTDYWAIVSDAGGNVLDTGRLENNSTYVFETTPGFKDESISLTLVYQEHVIVPDVKPWSYVDTYTNLPFGTYGYNSQPAVVTPQPAGKAELVVHGVAPGSSSLFWLSGPKSFAGSWSSDLYGDKLTYSFDMYVPRSKFILTESYNGFFRYLYNDISVGQNVFTTADFKPFDSWRVTMPVATEADYWLTGQNDAGAFNAYVLQYGVTLRDQVLVLPYAKDVFKSYAINLYAHQGDTHYILYRPSGVLPEVMKTIDGAIRYTVSGNTIMSAQPESCDRVTYMVEGYADDKNVRWSIYCPPGNRTVVVPHISQALADRLHIRQFDDLYSHTDAFYVALLDFSNFSGYTDFMTRTFVTGGENPGEFIGKWTTVK